MFHGHCMQTGIYRRSCCRFIVFLKNCSFSFSSQVTFSSCSSILVWVSLLSPGFSPVCVYALTEVPELDAVSQLGTYWCWREQEGCFMALWTTLLFVSLFSQQHDSVDVHWLNFRSIVMSWPFPTKLLVILISYLPNWLFLCQSRLLHVY